MASPGYYDGLGGDRIPDNGDIEDLEDAFEQEPRLSTLRQVSSRAGSGHEKALAAMVSAEETVDTALASAQAQADAEAQALANVEAARLQQQQATAADADAAAQIDGVTNAEAGAETDAEMGTAAAAEAEAEAKSIAAAAAEVKAMAKSIASAAVETAVMSIAAAAALAGANPIATAATVTEAMPNATADAVTNAAAGAETDAETGTAAAAEAEAEAKSIATAAAEAEAEAKSIAAAAAEEEAVAKSFAAAAVGTAAMSIAASAVGTEAMPNATTAETPALPPAAMVVTRPALPLTLSGRPDRRTREYKALQARRRTAAQRLICRAWRARRRILVVAAAVECIVRFLHRCRINALRQRIHAEVASLQQQVAPVLPSVTVEPERNTAFSSKLAPPPTAALSPESVAAPALTATAVQALMDSPGATLVGASAPAHLLLPLSPLPPTSPQHRGPAPSPERTPRLPAGGSPSSVTALPTPPSPSLPMAARAGRVA